MAKKVYNPFNTSLLTEVNGTKIDIPPRSFVLLPDLVAEALQERHPGLEYPTGEYEEPKEELKEEPKKKERKLKAKKVTAKKHEKKRK